MNSFTERLGREALPPSDSGRWGDAGVVPRRGDADMVPRRGDAGLIPRRGDAGVIPRRRHTAQRQGDKVTVTERTLA